MILSEISLKRPTLTSVVSIILFIFGSVSFWKLPLREYPDIDPPIVTIETTYLGASSRIVETRISQVLEDRISGIEGIKSISSSSEDGRSTITLEFLISRDIEAATNDVRDRVSTALDDLPEEADPPEVRKADSSDDVIMWLNLVSDDMSLLELTDYANRFLQDRFSSLPGVARVRIGGGLDYAMRVWLDRQKLAAHNLTARDVEVALRNQNIERPAGSLESDALIFTARLQRSFQTEDDFRNLILVRREGGQVTRLKDVATVSRDAAENRIFFRGNQVPMVGIGLIKQSRANTIEVSRAGKALARQLAPDLPKGMKILESYDTSVFIEQAIKEVYGTLLIAMALVIAVIYLFLRDVRSVFIPAITIPVTLVGTFSILLLLDLSINLITLLALVLIIGLIVDDAIVVLENIARRLKQYGETPLVASWYGAKQIGFAVLATSLVLITVFIPITFLEGDLGRLFSEFSWTIVSAIGISTFIALTLSPMLCSKILQKTPQNEKTGRQYAALKKTTRPLIWYKKSLRAFLKRPFIAFTFFAVILVGGAALYPHIQQEYTPQEDRGAFFIFVNGPEGASFDYTSSYMTHLETELMSYVDSGEIDRLLVRAPRSFGTSPTFSNGIIIIVLSDWKERRSGFTLMGEIAGRFGNLPGVQVFPVMRQGFTVGTRKPVQFVLMGASYEELSQWQKKLFDRISKDNPGLEGLDYDFKPSKPQLDITIDHDRALDLGVSHLEIGEILEIMLGGKRVTTFLENGEEYDVILEGMRRHQRTVGDLRNVYVRSATAGKLIPLDSLVQIHETSDSRTLNRYNRNRALTIEASLSPDLSLGRALEYLENITREELGEAPRIDYKGESLSFRQDTSSVIWIFALSVVLVFLVLAAQFETYRHPFVILGVVPFGIIGSFVGLYLWGQSFNVYTQVALIMMIGLASKNGILIVEFANQLRDEGLSFDRALEKASLLRLRPIVMTSLTTIIGTFPLLMASGAGSETRFSIGVVIFSGVLVSSFVTLYYVPLAYRVLARGSATPKLTSQKLEKEMAQI